jgi:FkbM family methyltransferase
LIEEHWLEKYIDRAKQFGATTAIDIGANVGTWTELMLKKFDRVIAVEPDIRAYWHLMGKFHGNERVLLFNAAVTRQDGQCILYTRPDTLQSSLLANHPIGAGGRMPAPAQDTAVVAGMTLDTVLRFARDRFGDIGTMFVKVDVEGAEGDVLQGATVDEFRAAAWLIEVHDRVAEVGGGLQKLGYEMVAIVPHPSPAAHPRHGWVYTEPQNEHS